MSEQQFSNNASITFLLDGTPISGQHSVQSDAHSNIKTDLAVTETWTVDKHTLTARGAQNNITKTGVNVIIVLQKTTHPPLRTPYAIMYVNPTSQS